MSGAYYNEIDPHAAQVLRNLIAARDIPDGDVDVRSIVDVRPDDLRGYTQVHLFAGIGGWPATLRRIGWPDDRPAWTASVPCQGFSRAGKKLGFDDPRHLWPVVRPLVAELRPPVLFGEQSADFPAWLGLVRGNLEALEYAVGAVPIEAACAGAEHRRQRYYFVADADDEPRRLEQRLEGRRPQGPWDESRWGTVGHAAGNDERWPGISGRAGGVQDRGPSAGDGFQWYADNKGKARRGPPGIRMLAAGVSGKVDRRDADGETSFYSRIAALKGFGNAIDLRPASQFVAACMNYLIPLFIAAVTALIAAAASMGGGGTSAGIG